MDGFSTYRWVVLGSPVYPRADSVCTQITGGTRGEAPASRSAGEATAWSAGFGQGKAREETQFLPEDAWTWAMKLPSFYIVCSPTYGFGGKSVAD